MRANHKTRKPKVISFITRYCFEYIDRKGNVRLTHSSKKPLPKIDANARNMYTQKVYRGE